MGTIRQPVESRRTRPQVAEESATHLAGEEREGKELRFIDLFCGCGGFTLGLERAGFHCIAAVDFDPVAVTTLRANMPHVPHVLQKDLTTFPPGELAALLGACEVDVIVGGPPCQGFSITRRVDGANHGERLKEDPCRYLYREFLRYMDFFQPRVCVMENVRGPSDCGGDDGA